MAGLMILIPAHRPGPMATRPDRANVDAMTRRSSSVTRSPAGDGRVVRTAAHEAARRPAPDADEAIFHPIAERLLERCDGCLRIGGASAGADRMVETARRLGKAVWFRIDEVPA
jgi:hypothetical protein